MSTGWSIFIIVLTVGNILGCVWLLWWTSRSRPSQTTTETTGHTWDGDLQELNNPLPRWWLWLFYITIIFSGVYLILYPGLGNYEGTLGWTQEKRYEEESARIEARQAEFYAQFDGMSVTALAQNDEAMDVGNRIFANNCAVCHGSDGRGAKGFPNLADDAWQYGGEPEQILTSIRNGRNGVMPALGGALGGEQGIAEVSAYVWQLNGREPDQAMAALVGPGEQRYKTVCAACHGVEGKGNIALGAPNLTDDTWLYGGAYDDIRKSVRNGRQGQMPAHDKLLSDDEIRVVAAYVYGLGKQKGDE
ncbi:MAG: cytochrome-c oxidase, cbb3-type subunit III [Gammaproteobacteria bacterium]|nr:cytochrome-c oxidase, cbb3-type subunit III [Gammaproteobacteria bacterium]